MQSATAKGAWYGKSHDHFITRGASVTHGEGGWYARCGRTVRGPLSCLPVALEAADRMLAEAAKTDAAA
jgi:hypothetical protein